MAALGFIYKLGLTQARIFIFLTDSCFATQIKYHSLLLEA